MITAEKAKKNFLSILNPKAREFYDFIGNRFLIEGEVPNEEEKLEILRTCQDLDPRIQEDFRKGIYITYSETEDGGHVVLYNGEEVKPVPNIDSPIDLMQNSLEVEEVAKESLAEMAKTEATDSMQNNQEVELENPLESEDVIDEVIDPIVQHLKILQDNEEGFERYQTLKSELELAAQQRHELSLQAEALDNKIEALEKQLEDYKPLDEVSLFLTKNQRVANMLKSLLS